MRRFLLALLLLASGLARATDYTDIWFDPAEQSTGGGGWGVNVVQSDRFMFLTFFIYGPGNTPTWYVAGLNEDANGNFSGPLYATRGTYFAAPWNPADGAGSAQVGTASFSPTGPYSANLAYSITGGASVAKPIQRQALTSIALGGAYMGTQQGTYTPANCPFGAYTDNFNLNVTHVTGTSLTFHFAFASGLSCTLSGALQQFGQLYNLPSASYTCSDGLSTTASVSEIKATNFGIEGRLDAPNVGSGCSESATFSGVFLPPI